MNNRKILPQLASLYQAIDIRQQIPPLIVGERTNPTGSKKFRELLLADDFDGCLQVAMDQEQIGAHVLDVSGAWAGRNEKEDLTRLVRLFSRNLKIPLMVDSTSPEVVESALQNYPGRPVINSINLEDGGENLHQICKLAKKYGACLVALTIDENGMAMTTDKKFVIAKRIYNIVVDQYGLAPSDLFFDPLTFTVGSGDEKLKDAAIQTLDAIKWIKEKLSGCNTILGLSNISFGLPAGARRILNAVFLHEALEYGLDSVIINPSNCISLDTLDPESLRVSKNLLYNRQEGELSPLMEFIQHFEGLKEDDEKQGKNTKPIEDELFEALLRGNKSNLPDLIHMLLDKYSPLDIVNKILVQAMKKVGELFGSGEMLLPFVLQSAEVMKKSVDLLEPYMDKSSKEGSLKILLATVKGDVHDIGKNLVNIIFSNNGYDVVDLGIKVPAEKIIEEAKKHDVDVICLSGLLVKSAVNMKSDMSVFKKAGLTVPVFLGGAALTKKFVATECVPEYDGNVVYCKDAFAGLQALQEHEKGQLQSSSWSGKTNAAKKAGKAVTVEPAKYIPSPAHFGPRQLEVTNNDFLSFMKTRILFRGRWGYIRGSMSKEGYQNLLDTEVIPKFNEIKQYFLENNLLQPKVQYGWFHCHKEDERLFVQSEDREYIFHFPRQKFAPHRCLNDYFREKRDGDDVVGLFIVTIGHRASEVIKKVYEKGEYHDYLLMHGFSVEAAEALAEYTHKVMRNEMGLVFKGERYSFGYSSCPDLSQQKPLLEILRSEEIELSLTENFEMVPEQSISAIVVHHPQASYFSV